MLFRSNFPVLHVDLGDVWLAIYHVTDHVMNHVVVAKDVQVSTEDLVCADYRSEAWMKADTHELVLVERFLVALQPPFQGVVCSLNKI